MLGGGGPNKNLLMTLTARNVGTGVEGWDCGVAAVASLKATCFHSSASGHDATANPLLRLTGLSTRPDLATEGSPPQQTPATGNSILPQFEGKNWKKLALWLLRKRVCCFVLCFAVLLIPAENHLRSEAIRPYTRRSRDASCF